MAFPEQRRSQSAAYKYVFRVSSIDGSTVKTLWEGDSLGAGENEAERFAVQAREQGSSETVVLDSFRYDLEKQWVQRHITSRAPSLSLIRRSSSGHKNRPKILYMPMEFPTWANGAHSWSFAAALAYVRALEAAGCEVTTINTAAAPFQRKLLRGKRFDQVWFHCHPRHIDDFSFRQWIADIAPVRLMLCGETLHYLEIEEQKNPWLISHGKTFERWVPFVTHAAFVDPADMERARSKIKRTMWWQQAVPKACVRQVNTHPSRNAAIFVGTLYPPRDRWAWELGDLLERLECPESDLFQWLFERSHEWIQTQLEALPDILGLGPGPAPPYPQAWKADLLLRVYNAGQVALRRHAFDNFLKSIRSGIAVVNLPSDLKTYSGRVFEGMAAGRPVLTQRLSGHDFFEDGKEILHYESVEELAEHIRMLRDYPQVAEIIAGHARAAVLAKHTVEIRARQLLEFVEGA